MRSTVEIFIKILLGSSARRSTVQVSMLSHTLDEAQTDFREKMSKKYTKGAMERQGRLKHKKKRKADAFRCMGKT